MRIPRELNEVCNRIVAISPWNIAAIVLVGSFSTEEGTVIRKHENEIEQLSDYDLEILVRFYDPFLLKRANIQASHSSLKLSIGIIPVNQLNKLKMIQTFDMKKKGVVLIGNRKLLDRIPMHAASDVPRYEAIRRLLNSVMEMNEAIRSYKDLTTKLYSHNDLEIAYSIAKAYLACCTALLTLVGKYRLTYKDRDHLFSKIFASHFKELFEKYPSFPMKVHTSLKFKLDPKPIELSEFPKEWFEVRDCLLNTLKYVLSKYFKDSNRDIFSLLKNLDNLPPKPLHNIAYILSLLLKRKIPPLRAFYVTPMIKIQTAGVYLIKSINEDGSINKELLNKAFEKTKRINSINTGLNNDWNSIKNAIVNAWHMAPDYSID